MTDEEPTTPDGAAGEDATTMSLARISWSVCALAFVAGGVALLIRGDIGYAIVTLVVAVGAAINLAP